MLYFVTGATGFLGSHITKQLLSEGHTVYVLLHKSKSLQLLGLSHKNLIPIIGDITNQQSFQNVFKKGLDGVFHCASVVSFDKSKESFMYKINVEGTNNILDVSLQYGVKKFVYISSVNALGYPEEGEIGNEQTFYNWENFNIPYMKTKYKAEKAVLKAFQKGLNAVIVNPGTMFGAGDINKHSGEYIIGSYKGILKTYIEGGFTQCIVKNVAAGALQAMKNGKAGERYILGGFNYSYKEFFDLIAEVLHTPKPKIKIPRVFFTIAGYFIYYFDILRFRTPRITPELIKVAPKHLFYSSAKAIKDLNYNLGTKEDLKKALLEHFLFYKKNSLLN